MEGPPEARGEEEPSGEVRGGRASRVCALAGGGHVSPRDVGRVPIVYPGGGAAGVWALGGPLGVPGARTRVTGWVAEGQGHAQEA